MLNVKLLEQMAKVGQYDLPTLLDYKNGGQISKWVKDSGLDLGSLKPYTKLSKEEVISIFEKGAIPNSKIDEMTKLVAFLKGGELPKEEVSETVKATAKSTVNKKTTVIGEQKTDSEFFKENQLLRKKIDFLKKENASLKIVAKIMNKDEYEKYMAKIEVDKEIPQTPLEEQA